MTWVKTLQDHISNTLVSDADFAKAVSHRSMHNRGIDPTRPPAGGFAAPAGALLHRGPCAFIGLVAGTTRNPLILTPLLCLSVCLLYIFVCLFLSPFVLLTFQAATFPNNTPQSKEEYYYRSVFEKYYPGCDKFVHVWDGGCRAGGAAFKSKEYTRAGLVDTELLKKGHGVASQISV